MSAGPNGSKVGHSGFHKKETGKFNAPTSGQYGSSGGTWN